MVCPPASHIHRIPATVLPPSIPPHVCSLLTNRPLSARRFPLSPPKASQPPYSRLHQSSSNSNILELKSTRTPPQNQYDRAISQHRPLADAIQQAAPQARVTYIPHLLLGVAGTIYSSTTSHLRYLGVRKQAHSPACSTASMLWPSPTFTGFTPPNVIRNVTSIRSFGATPIHPDNIGGWVNYPPTYVFWAPNGSGPIYIIR